MAVGLALLLLPSAALSTVGEPTWIKVLGYDPRDAKVFFLVDSGYSACLHFVRLARPSKVVLVKSYYAAGQCTPDTHYQAEDKIAALRKRLRAMPLLAAARRVDEEAKYGSKLPPGLGEIGVQRKILRRWRDAEYQARCRTVELTLSQPKLGLVGTTTVTACGPQARATALYQIPQRPELLVLVSSMPTVFEGGYEVQVPLLLRRRSAKAAGESSSERSEPPAIPRSKERVCRAASDCVVYTPPRSGCCPPCGPTWRRAANRRYVEQLKKAGKPCRKKIRCRSCATEWLGTRAVCVDGQCVVRP